MTAEELVGVNKKEVLRAKIENIRSSDLMDQEFVTVKPGDDLNGAIAKMRELDLHEIPVSGDGKRLAGVVSYGTLLRRKNLPIGTKVSSIMIMPPLIEADAPLTEVAEALIREGYRQMPLVNNGKIVGILSRGHMLSILQDIPDLRDIPIETVMSPEVKTVKMEDRIVDAVTLMRNLDIRTLPVMDSSDRLMGIVGIRDVVNYNWREKRRQTMGELVGSSYPTDVQVSSVMIDEPVITSPDTTLGDAAALLLQRNISTLPVVDEGRLRGIITRYDIVELIASFRRRDMMYMQIEGLDREDRFSMEQMERIITQSVQKIARIVPPLMFTLHVGKYSQEGVRAKYSLNGRLVTANGVMNANAVQWDLIQATT
ncbi:MAG: CBS domain-containing protein, partial [Euryarchaeota archaeon]|nr:CBS domain-containing protein [Euryarchaeota archaeon]